MTEIMRLLNESAAKEFEKIMYGDGQEKGLDEVLPVGTTFDDMALECICTMLILEQEYKIDSVGKNKLYRLYAHAL